MASAAANVMMKHTCCGQRWRGASTCRTSGSACLRDGRGFASRPAVRCRWQADAWRRRGSDRPQPDTTRTGACCDRLRPASGDSSYRNVRACLTARAGRNRAGRAAPPDGARSVPSLESAGLVLFGNCPPGAGGRVTPVRMGSCATLRTPSSARRMPSSGSRGPRPKIGRAHV